MDIILKAQNTQFDERFFLNGFIRKVLNARLRNLKDFSGKMLIVDVRYIVLYIVDIQNHADI